MRAHDEPIKQYESMLIRSTWQWTLDDLFWLAYGLGFDEGMREAELNHQRKGN